MYRHTIAVSFACTIGATPYAAVLFENVRIFSGKNAALSGARNVLVRGNTITKISKDRKETSSTS